ncbi:MAG: hypothetical protein EA349_05845 [Halomonadaceae bacterium]|nr:MAG: hypothetical protein EA349_05845 [Halomonadaceae bacterium]
MYRTLSVVLATTLLCLTTITQAETWKTYPLELADFEFSDESLTERWQALTLGLRGPLPTAESVRKDAERWPKVTAHTQELLRERATHDERFAYFTGDLEQHYDTYAQQLRQAWRLLLEGQFQQARDLGLALGPAGYFPGLYAQALYATLIEDDSEQREALLKEVIALTDEILPLAPDHPMIRFGNAYGKARIMEDMSRGAAMSTGYTSEVKDQLEELLKEDENNIFAISLLGGVHGGIVDKAGGLLARMTFGAREKYMVEYFDQALSLNPQYPALYYEYARGLINISGRSGRRQAQELLETGAGMTPRSAEEALQIQACKELLATLN